MHHDHAAWFTVETPLPTGSMRIGVTDRGVVATTSAAEATPDAPTGDRRVVAVTDRLTEYFAGRRRDLDLPIDWRLTSGVQETVLRTLHRTVGYGRTITYGELAESSGAFGTDPEDRGLRARTVGSILGSAPISVLLPCHRVVAADGIGGYGGGPDGLATKRWLLTLEGVLPPTLDFSPSGD